jgi:hypothetical protein
MNGFPLKEPPLNHFFLGFRCCPLGLSAFFFPVFLLEKFMRSEAEQTTTGSGKREKRVSK